jgi:hypothetical protein
MRACAGNGAGSRSSAGGITAMRPPRSPAQCKAARCNNGVQLKTLQDTAGHANIATTAAYLHKTDNEWYDDIIRSANDKSIL